MPVLKPPSSSPLTTVAAGQYGVQIRDRITNTWLWLNGISKFEPKNKNKLEDDSDIYGENWDSQIAMGNGLEISIEGLVKGSDIGTFVTDPGLAILLNAREQTGFDNTVELRYWRHDDLPESKQATFAVELSLNGGKPNEAQKFSGTLHGRGRPNDIPKPQVSASSFTVATTGTPTGGTYKLAVDGVETGDLAYDASSAVIQTALAALTNVGTGNVTVSGTTSKTVTLANGGILTADSTGLTGGTSPAVTVTPV